MTFVGFGALGGDFSLTLQCLDANRQPVEPDAAPTFQCYSAEGLMPAVNGTLALGHVKTLTGATNANPIVLTAANHGITTGTRVRVRNVVGNTAANTTQVATRLTANTFSIPVAGNGAYVSGGTVEVVGLYQATLTLDGGVGFEVDQQFFARFAWTVGSAARAELQSFTVT
jgi:hypothetical protein